MAEELEIKLSLTEQALEQAGRWLLTQPGAREAETRLLENHYFDTPEAELNRQKVALRVRKVGGRFIQTLKTQGEFVDGAHRRQEWEWPLMGTSLNIGLIADTPVGQDINLAALKPVFETRFTRRIIMLEGSGAVIECALDSGVVRAGDQEQPLCELELELKSGQSAALLSWAHRLAEQVPVFLNLISKAEQGYTLAGIHSPRALGDDRPALERLLHGLSRAWLCGSVDDESRFALTAVMRDLQGSPLSQELAWLERCLDEGQAVAALARDPRLGRLQLALLQS